MPEFILNTDGATLENWYALDDFAKGFVEAMFFCEVSCFDSSEFFDDEAQEAVREGQADGSIPSDAGPANLDSESLARIREFCADFQKRAAGLLAAAYERPDYEEEQAGRDLYFTYAGHGVGFWDRKQLDTPEGDDVESLGDRLSDACGRGEIVLDACQLASADGDDEADDDETDAFEVSVWIC